MECGRDTSAQRLHTCRAAQLQGVPAVWEGDERDERVEGAEEADGDGAVTDEDGEEAGAGFGTGGDESGLRDDQNNAIVIRFGVESCSCQGAALCLLPFSPTLFDAGDVR